MPNELEVKPPLPRRIATTEGPSQEEKQQNYLEALKRPLTGGPTTFQEGAEYITGQLEGGGAFGPGAAVGGMLRSEIGPSIEKTLQKVGIFKAGEVLPDSWKAVIGQLPPEAVSHLREVMAIDSKQGVRALAALVNPQDAERWWIMGLGKTADPGSAAHEVFHYYYKVLPQATKDSLAKAMGSVQKDAAQSQYLLTKYSTETFAKPEEFGANAYAMYLSKDPKYKDLPEEARKAIESVHSIAGKWQGKMKPGAEVGQEVTAKGIKSGLELKEQAPVKAVPELSRPTAKLLENLGVSPQEYRLLGKKEMGDRVSGRNYGLRTVDLLEGKSKIELEKTLAHEDIHTIYDTISARVPPKSFQDLVVKKIPQKAFDKVPKGTDPRDHTAEAFAYWLTEMPEVQRITILQSIVEKVPRPLKK